MDMCRACLAEGTDLLRMDEEFLGKYNLLTDLDVKLSEDTATYTCKTCYDAVYFCIEFVDKCIASNLTIKKIADIATNKDKDEEEIILKTELKFEYDDTNIKFEGFDGDEDDIELSKLSVIKHKEEDHKCIETGTLLINNNTVIKTALKRIAKSCTSKKREIKNLQKNEKTNLLPCGLCSKSLRNTADFHHHLEHHKLDVSCGLCPQLFTGLPHLYSHRIVHLPDDKRRCHLCSKKAWSLDNLEFHYMRVHNMAEKDAPIQCKHCPRTCMTVRKMRLHMKTHSDSKFFCKLCNKGFATSSGFKKHEFTHNEDGQYKCDLCDFAANYPDGVKLHKLRKHTEGRVYCNPCSRVFRSQSLRDQHVCKVADNVVCAVCGFNAKNKKSFQRHMQSHSDVYPYACDQCPAKFRGRANYRQHLDRHAGTPRHCCQYCGRRFYSQSVLVKHRRIHTGEKPYVCEICSRGFTGNHNLKVHMKIHGMSVIKSKNIPVSE